MARAHRSPKEEEPAPAWPWWVEAQAAFHSGDLEAVRLIARSCMYDVLWL